MTPHQLDVEGPDLVKINRVRIEVDVHRDAMRERALELGAEPVGRLGFANEGEDVVGVVENIWRTLVHITREDTTFLR